MPKYSFTCFLFPLTFILCQRYLSKYLVRETKNRNMDLYRSLRQSEYESLNYICELGFVLVTILLPSLTLITTFLFFSQWIWWEIGVTIFIGLWTVIVVFIINNNLDIFFMMRVSYRLSNTSLTLQVKKFKFNSPVPSWHASFFFFLFHISFRVAYQFHLQPTCLLSWD